MKRRTLRLDDLKTLAAVCHEYDAIDWPPRDTGGWATATLNGHPYKARVAAEATCPGCGEAAIEGPIDSDGREWCGECARSGEPS